MAGKLTRQFGTFLRQTRGETPLVAFARVVKEPKSKLHRIEQGAQKVSLDCVENIARHLKVSLHDIFPREFPGTNGDHDEARRR